ncbi:ectoine/hydroxyectoine ABC transporter permease subunit EhuD [Pararhizobium sp. YC-54]|uniref:ectoine/hydroxyectoine ABC transporter permease subunit EhuD n=1 Tax=Pararhizobium sp. YC-54 TaxID=2986920 RepID=UPI0021F6B2D3|nr:ectoine/hydroxyectoine ABC transporter permease subunit EhuD [Pararhizobium sp. YC-54]MCV9999362.1 ectoine/hydroxyectoine ABC transporter permease subunit EhuD [Pararhizobium sp. YC-54]
MTFDFDFALQVLPDLVRGFAITIQATVGGSVLALALGLAFALANRSENRLLRVCSGSASEFLRRTPLLVQLFFIFYVLPDVGIVIPPIWAGILALGLHSSAYMSEVYRAGIEAVPKGQWEAALALNYHPVQTWRRVILPQAIPPMVPALGNYVVLMFKETALLAVITVPEAMNTARDIGNSTYQYTEPVTVVGILYLLISIPVVLALRFIERRVHQEAA